MVIRMKPGQRLLIVDVNDTVMLPDARHVNPMSDYAIVINRSGAPLEWQIWPGIPNVIAGFPTQIQDQEGVRFHLVARPNLADAGNLFGTFQAEGMARLTFPFGLGSSGGFVDLSAGVASQQILAVGGETVGGVLVDTVEAYFPFKGAIVAKPVSGLGAVKGAFSFTTGFDGKGEAYICAGRGAGGQQQFVNYFLDGAWVVGPLTAVAEDYGGSATTSTEGVGVGQSQALVLSNAGQAGQAWAAVPDAAFSGVLDTDAARMVDGFVGAAGANDLVYVANTQVSTAATTAGNGQTVTGVWRGGTQTFQAGLSVASPNVHHCAAAQWTNQFAESGMLRAGGEASFGACDRLIEHVTYDSGTSVAHRVLPQSPALFAGAGATTAPDTGRTYFQGGEAGGVASSAILSYGPDGAWKTEPTQSITLRTRLDGQTMLATPE